MRGVFDKKEIRKWDIYRMINPDGGIYIGCTCRFKSRMSRYRHNQVPHQAKVYDSIKKYGFNAHKIDIIDSFEGDSIFAGTREIFWIKAYKSNIVEYPEGKGLNQSIGGGFAPHLQSPENRKKNKEALHRDPSILIERGKKISQSKMGHTHSQKTIDKIRETRKELYGKVIEQYSVNGEFIQEFRCYTDAVKLSGAGKTTIYNSLNNLVKTTPKKYIFKYKQENNFHKVAFQRRIFKKQEIKTA